MCYKLKVIKACYQGLLYLLSVLFIYFAAFVWGIMLHGLKFDRFVGFYIHFTFKVQNQCTQYETVLLFFKSQKKNNEIL